MATARTYDESRFRLGTMLFLVAAGLSFLLSIGLWFAGSRQEGGFVGLWGPSILAAGALLVSAGRGGLMGGRFLRAGGPAPPLGLWGGAPSPPRGPGAP